MLEANQPFDFINKIKIIRKIGEGGMGTVYLASQFGAEGFRKTVAIKTLRHTLQDEKYKKLFIAEAKLVADLVHENIVQIYQLAELDGQFFIVMEYVNGISLENFITYHRIKSIPITEELSVYIASRIARGLAYAHKKQDALGHPLHIVHRDVCPANILITKEGLPKLADFGIARVAGSVLKEFSGGKRLYMPPEQARGEPVDFRADQFTLGAVLFEMLSFKKIREIAANAVDQKIPFELLPEKMSDEARHILEKMLAENPAERYEDTDLLAQTLEYHIYKGGYGPTIKTLELYLRKHFPYLYKPEDENTSPEQDLSRDATIITTEQM
jgi:serine/threonine protein kinase